MRIMVFDVPAESGGALTILNQYHELALKDKEKEWVFVVSSPQLKESIDVKVLNFPWVKKTWIHRIYFDMFVAHKLVKKYEINEILSLQNIIIPFTDVNQTVYLHQSIPFSEKRYRLTENFRFWIYQNVISKLIFYSIKKAHRVIVQTKWIMFAAIKKVNVPEEKFIIIKPEHNLQVKKHYKKKKSSIPIFFYPASGFDYKNHKIIVDAVSILSRKNIEFKVIFTLDGNESKNIKKLYNIVKENNLPIEFIGNIQQDEVYKYYTKSILIFPSYIESFGLPLLEAKMHRSPIIASDCAFSHEILEDYEKAVFFNPFDSEELSQRIAEKLPIK